jgi:predicted component of type VI protein secretion system
VIDAHPCHIKAQTDAQQQTDGMFQADIFLNSQIKELDEMLQKQMNVHREEKSDWKNLEKALRGQIKQLKNTIAVMESDKQNSDRTPTVVILTPKLATWKIW